MRKIKTEDDPVLLAIKERLRVILSENAGQIILFGLDQGPEGMP